MGYINGVGCCFELQALISQDNINKIHIETYVMHYIRINIIIKIKG